MAYFFVGKILKKCGIILVDIFNFFIKGRKKFTTIKSREYFTLKSIGNIVKKFMNLRVGISRLL